MHYIFDPIPYVDAGMLNLVTRFKANVFICDKYLMMPVDYMKKGSYMYMHEHARLAL